MESTAGFEDQGISDNKNVSTEPFCELKQKTNYSTEDFLRHEGNVSYNDFTESVSEDITEPKIPNSAESNEVVINPEPASNNLPAMEGRSEESQKENESSVDNNNVFLRSKPIDKTTKEIDTDTNIGGNERANNDFENVLPVTKDISQSPDQHEPVKTEPHIDEVLESSHTESDNVKNSDEHNDSIETNGETANNSGLNGTSEEMKKEEEPKPEWMDILGSGHLLKKLINAGEPDTRPNKSDICVISATGRLEDGTVVEKLENIKIHLNDNEVIQGIDFALALMDKGEEAEVKVGPRFAYGSLGRKPDIPSGAILFYTVKLHDILDDPPIHTLPANERITQGLQKKERGNWWYSRDEHSIAINCYRRALEYLDDTEIPEPQDEAGVRKIVEERLKTYNNLTASQMKIHAYDAALMSVNYVLTSQPQNVKALFRKSKILKEKGDISEAIKVVRVALSFDKDSPSLQLELSSLLAAQRKHNTEQRELYKKMMGTSASQDKAGDKQSSRSTFSVIKWTSIFAFAAAIVAGTVALKYKT